MSVSKRRLACPQTVQHLWDAIVYIRQQKQIQNMDRISAYMRRKHNLNPSDLERQLNFAVRDELVTQKMCMGNKGTKAGVEQEGFKLPFEPVVKDGHDWYCYECHRGGEVMLCSTCHRVYHSFCVKEDLTTSESFVCSVCKMLNSKNNFKLKKDELNSLLGYTCMRLKDKFKDLHEMPHPSEEAWRHDYVIFFKMDLNSIEEKTAAIEYKRLEEFQIDAQTIVHNVVVYHGVHSPMADMARQMLRDCIYDLGEIRQCKDCYRTSNEKNDKFWFCEPCDPAHELVYAKQKGFPFWPAKVIRKNNGIYDVRFFGGHHQRANVEAENIRPIKTNIQQLTLKRSVSQNKALEELRRHQQLLEELGCENEKANVSPPHPPLDVSDGDDYGDDLNCEVISEIPAKKTKIDDVIKSKSERKSASMAAPKNLKNDKKLSKKSENEELSMEKAPKENASATKVIKTEKNSVPKSSKNDKLSETNKTEKVPVKKTPKNTELTVTKIHSNKNVEPLSKSGKNDEHSVAKVIKQNVETPSGIAGIKTSKNVEISIVKTPNKNVEVPPVTKVAKNVENVATVAANNKAPKIATPNANHGHSNHSTKNPSRSSSGSTNSNKVKTANPKAKGRRPQLISYPETESSQEEKSESEAEIHSAAKAATGDQPPLKKKKEMATASVSNNIITIDDAVPSSTSNKLTKISEFQAHEDHNNLVSSSSQEAPAILMSVSTQTHKKAGAKPDPPAPLVNCDCESKYHKLLKEQQDRLEAEYTESQKRMLREHAERLKAVDEQKSQEAEMAMEKLKRDLEGNHQKTQEQLRLLHEQENRDQQERAKLEISETKKKQWCYNCEIEAIYHCCWNTSYCSVDCQQVHWQKEHKRTCRRKR